MQTKKQGKDWYAKNRQSVLKRYKEWQNKNVFGGMKFRVLKRDNYRCQICKTRKNRLVVHHFDGDKSNNTYWNLLTLCAGCHRLIHRGFF